MQLPPSNQVLHLQQNKSWFNSRCAQKAKLQYLKTKREISNDEVVSNTFRLMDKDQSKTLEIDELYSMFQKNGYPVNIGLLKGFFEKADKDNNRSIELEEFKHVIYDEQATQSFRNMMRRMREQKSDDNYYSTDFVPLLRYLSYCQDRNDLQLQIQNHRLPIEKRSNLISKLIELNQQYNMDQQYNLEELHVKPYKKVSERKILPPIHIHHNNKTDINSQLRINLSDICKSSQQSIPTIFTNRSEYKSLRNCVSLTSKKFQLQ